MKHLLGYVIWNKVNMLDWIADGIVESFKPSDVDLLFVLDNPKDGTEKKLNELIATKLNNFKIALHVFETETYKFPCQNLMMKYCIDHCYKSLIAPQDDQKITDSNLIENIDNLFDIYQYNLGIIGLRDGFEFGYKNMVSSEWSESTYSTLPRLKQGEFIERPLLNDGGLIYPNKIITEIGLNDVTTFKRFYIEDDYCMRTHLGGFSNIVLGNSLIHKKENASLNSTHYDDDTSFHDLTAFRKKWNL